MERQQYFDSFLLPKLRDEYRISQSSAKTIRTVLIKKGALYEDPYKYDSKLSDIEIPSEDTYTETEKAVEIGRRLARYEAMIDFLNNYYQFNCDFLDTNRINKMVALNRSFNWESFSPNSAKVNTKGLAELVTNVRNNADPLSLSIINDSLGQLSKSSATITKYLKELTDFHKERYKLMVRKMVMAGIPITPPGLTTGSGTAMKEIKRAFVTNMKDQPFYTELVEEILKEDYAPDHAVLQQELLAKLSTTKKSDKKSATEESLKPVLLDGIRTIGSAAPQLEVILTKIQENHQLLLNSEQGFFRKLQRTFRKAFNIQEAEQPMTILCVDPVTQTSKKDTFVFSEFVEEVKRKSRIFNGFTVRTSPAFQKIEAMQEPQILDLLTRNVAELNNLLKQFAGLDEYFKQTAQNETREHIRGIKVEISAIRNNLVKANQSRAEYASQVEELQQLKKLGITNV